MLNLDYIIVGMLPAEEQRYLEENLNRDGLVFAGQTATGGYEGWKVFCRPGAGCAATEGTAIREVSLSEGGILISGNREEIAAASARGIATLGYSPVEQPVTASAGPASAQPDLHSREQPAVSPAASARADLYAEGFEEIGYAFLERVFRRHHHLPWTILTTERCVVKEFSMDYLDALFELYAGEGMTAYIPPLYPYEQERDYQQSYIECMYGFYGYGMWIVCDKVTGRLIGRAGIECREELGGEQELGYVIGVPYQRRGYALEVCTAILAYAGEELALPFVNCLIEEGNLVSEHVAQRLGFSLEGEIFLDGKRMKKYRFYFREQRAK